ncbi:Hypothetical predicted protein [Cloeon dipterum]|uniref:Kelch domain-containing protein 2 n=1 Tax=Cloeon dipterum TaxID=197152 RepID=A0A8S1D929_9INSE|nr:Hypothetical predicted protein [Cloeon dipterum]
MQRNLNNFVPVDADAEHFHKRIHCRSGHITVRYRDHVLVWGGSREVHYDNGTNHEYHDANELMMYNCLTEVWTRQFTSGEVPFRCSGACGVVLDHFLYVFGGFQVIFDDFFQESIEAPGNSLHRLDLRTMTWQELRPAGVHPVPCDKLAGWEFNGRLYFFGGFGPPPEDFANAPFTYIQCTSNTEYPPRGWNNQFVCYDPEINCWTWPRTKGCTPSPKAAHAADIRNGKAYIFGGRLLQERVNELHCIDMDTLRWSGNLTHNASEAPEGRSWHSFTFIDNNTAIVYGGFSQKDMILSDVWSLDTENVKWSRVLGQYAPRLWHRAVNFSQGNREVELHVIGGYQTSVYQTKAELADSLLTLNFQPKSLFRLCIRACVGYSEETQSQWSVLPKAIERVLKARLEQV